MKSLLLADLKVSYFLNLLIKTHLSVSSTPFQRRNIKNSKLLVIFARCDVVASSISSARHCWFCSSSNVPQADSSCFFL